MGSALLSEEEKRRFSEYLSRQMIIQMEKLPEPVRNTMVQRERIKLAAWSIVLEDINSGELFEVRNKQNVKFT